MTQDFPRRSGKYQFAKGFFQNCINGSHYSPRVCGLNYFSLGSPGDIPDPCSYIYLSLWQSFIKTDNDNTLDFLVIIFYEH